MSQATLYTVVSILICCSAAVFAQKVFLHVLLLPLGRLRNTRRRLMIFCEVAAGKIPTRRRILLLGKVLAPTQLQKQSKVPTCIFLRVGEPVLMRANDEARLKIVRFSFLDFQLTAAVLAFFAVQTSFKGPGKHIKIASGIPFRICQGPEFLICAIYLQMHTNTRTIFRIGSCMLHWKFAMGYLEYLKIRNFNQIDSAELAGGIVFEECSIMIIMFNHRDRHPFQ